MTGARESGPATRQPRSDAARNRAAVLAAADALFRDAAQSGDVTTAAIAAAAGVGKATVFRAFGDRSALLRAVFDERFLSLRRRIDTGPPPLGTGGEPAERVLAILDAVLLHKIANRSLSMAIERTSDNSPFVGPHYEPVHAVIAAELGTLGLARAAEFVAHALLGVVRADLVEYQLGQPGWSRQRLRREVAVFAGIHLNTSKKE